MIKLYSHALNAGEIHLKYKSLVFILNYDKFVAFTTISACYLSFVAISNDIAITSFSLLRSKMRLS